MASESILQGLIVPLCTSVSCSVSVLPIPSLTLIPIKMALNPARRQTYSPAQIRQYYERIQFPASYHSISVSEIANKHEGLEFLALLQKHQLAYVPFENLELHYSSHHTITLDPERLFHKIVERNTGRGGYCMENSALFGAVLRSLGFNVVGIGAKVNEAVQPMAAGRNWEGPIYDGW